MLKVLKAGFFTTVQDRGRFGYRNKGVPVSGCMDTMSADRVNGLLENNADDAVLEITMTGPTLQFEEPTFICLGGADLSPTLNNEPIKNYEVIKIAANDILSYGRLTNGFRGYLGVKGGFQTERILGSRSYFASISGSTRVEEYEEIGYRKTEAFEPKLSSFKTDNFMQGNILRVHQGPDFKSFDEDTLQQLFLNDFTISKENNRMAYQLTEQFVGHSLNMLTSATMPGTVQLTPAGTLIILMRDGQTTGGYPRILQLTEQSICLLAQKKTRDAIRFQMIG